MIQPKVLPLRRLAADALVVEVAEADERAQQVAVQTVDDRGRRGWLE